MALLLPLVPARLALAAAAIVCVALVNSLLIWRCDLDKPLAPWRRRGVELSSQTACRVFLAAMGFWRPRVIGAENYAKGQQLGAVGPPGPLRVGRPRRRLRHAAGRPDAPPRAAWPGLRRRRRRAAPPRSASSTMSATWTRLSSSGRSVRLA